jgi:PAS domain S-box-containing protein
MLVPVKGTPFSLMTFIPSMEQLDFQSPRKIILMAGGFSLLFIAAMFTLMRLNTNNALLRTHLQEILLREKMVDEKNRELAAEIQVRQLAESALRDSEERYRAVAQSAHDAIVTMDHTGLIVGWNRGAERIFGYAAEAILDQPLTRLMPERYRDAHSFGKDRTNQADAPNIRGDATELRGLRKDGSEFPAEISLSKWDAHDTWFVTGIIRDITDRKRAEEESAKLQAQLLQSQKMESLGTLAGGIAHDMNNILGAILGLASVNLEGQPQGSQAYRSFETIAKAATRGGEMVRSLLAFARQGQAEDRVLDVNAILQEEIRLLERTTFSKVRLEVNLAPGLHPIRGDAGALTHAFMNLCVNAVDAMPEHGTLTLRTRNVDRAWIEVAVEDTGTGMPKAVLDKAMDPFFTTKGVGKGTGLGLSMVYSAVKAHQGQIEIHSAPGQGTQVRMRFPACEPAAAVAESVTGTRSETSKRALKVLLIDDDEMIQSSVETILQVLGHAVVTTPNGEDALARIETGFVPDVVILDMNMPGLGGNGTLPLLRALLPETPVLLSTGRTDQVALDLAKTHPFVTLLPKPFSIKELQQRLDSIGRG